MAGKRPSMVSRSSIVIAWCLGYSPVTTFRSSSLYHLLLRHRLPLYRGHLILTPTGIPTYRTLVQYVPQRPSLLPGTPLDFLHTIRSFRSRQARARSTRPSDSHASDGDYGAVRGSESIDPLELAAEWGIEKTMWKREWGTLSGGEGQRIALAVAVGVGGAEVVLLDGGSGVGLLTFQYPTDSMWLARLQTAAVTTPEIVVPLRSQNPRRHSTQRP